MITQRSLQEVTVGLTVYSVCILISITAVTLIAVDIISDYRCFILQPGFMRP